jgi:circadian clock protein KaiC
MAKTSGDPRTPQRTLEKVPSRIKGLDEITRGGLPKGRTTLVCGKAGSGKTLMVIEFLARGALEHGEPRVFLSFEETGEELAENVASLGFDLDGMCASGILALDYVHFERSEIEEAGSYDLSGLFIRLEDAIDSVTAKRVVLDTMVTGESGTDALTRHGLEEYVSDCVIFPDHRVTEQISTRRLRIVRYGGSSHGTNELPFLIDENGLSVMPITSTGLTREVTGERISSGIGRLDTMLGE